MTPLQWALAALSGMGAVAYGLILLQRPPSAARTVAKMLAVGALAALAWSMGAKTTGGFSLLFIALALSALGDGFLAGDPKRWLPFGMAAFLLAHAAYVALFLHAGVGLLMIRSEPVRMAGVFAALAAAVVMIRWLWPSLGPMRAPVSVYVAAVTLMALLAFTLPLRRWPAMIGASAFFISDALLAVRLFKAEGRPHRLADLAIWWLYYGGQAGIAVAFLR